MREKGWVPAAEKCVPSGMRIKFEKRDLWVGLYYETVEQTAPQRCLVTTWYLCLIPMLPIIWTTKQPITWIAQQHLKMLK